MSLWSKNQIVLMHGSWDINKMVVGESAWFPKFYEPIYLEIIWVCTNDSSVFSRNHKNWVHGFLKILWKSISALKLYALNEKENWKHPSCVAIPPPLWRISMLSCNARKQNRGGCYQLLNSMLGGKQHGIMEVLRMNKNNNGW